MAKSGSYKARNAREATAAIGGILESFRRSHPPTDPTPELVSLLKDELIELYGVKGDLDGEDVSIILEKFRYTAHEEKKARALRRERDDDFSPQQIPWPEGNRIYTAVAHLSIERIVGGDGASLMSFDDFIALLDAYFSEDEMCHLATIAPEGVAQHAEERAGSDRLNTRLATIGDRCLG